MFLEEILKAIEKIDPTLHKELKRVKRFSLMSWIVGWGVFSNAKAISRIKNDIRSLQFQNVLQELQILELTCYLNLTMVQVREQMKGFGRIGYQAAGVEQDTLMATMSVIKPFKVHMSQY